MLSTHIAVVDGLLSTHVVVVHSHCLSWWRMKKGFEDTR